MASTISAARGALYDLLVTAAGGAGPLSGVQISWGDPLAYEEQEVVALRGVTEPSADREGMGGIPAESYGIEVRVKVHGPEDDARTVDARGFALADAIRDAVEADPTLAGVVTQAIANGGRSEFGAWRPPDAPGWAILVDITVGCDSWG